MERHEIPTHLEVADRAFLGLTMRQLLSAAIGLALAYGVLSDLPVPFGLRIAAALVVIVAAAMLVLWRPAGRDLEEWAFVLLRYWTVPHVAVWRPPGRESHAREIPEVRLPETPPRPTREEATHAA